MSSGRPGLLSKLAMVDCLPSACLCVGVCVCMCLCLCLCWCSCVDVSPRKLAVVAPLPPVPRSAKKGGASWIKKDDSAAAAEPAPAPAKSAPKKKTKKVGGAGKKVGHHASIVPQGAQVAEQREEHRSQSVDWQAGTIPSVEVVVSQSADAP